MLREKRVRDFCEGQSKKQRKKAAGEQKKAKNKKKRKKRKKDKNFSKKHKNFFFALFRSPKERKQHKEDTTKKTRLVKRVY